MASSSLRLPHYLVIRKNGANWLTENQPCLLSLRKLTQGKVRLASREYNVRGKNRFQRLAQGIALERPIEIVSRAARTCDFAARQRPRHECQSTQSSFRVDPGVHAACGFNCFVLERKVCVVLPTACWRCRSAGGRPYSPVRSAALVSLDALGTERQPWSLPRFIERCSGPYVISDRILASCPRETRRLTAPFFRFHSARLG